MFHISILLWLLSPLLIGETVCGYKEVVPRTLSEQMPAPSSTASLMARQYSPASKPPSATTTADVCDAECNLEAFEVNIYYWPEPDANTSCLSTVGDNYSVPLQGVTTDSYGSLYWGCTTQNSLSGPVYVTTAVVTTIGDNLVKESLFNPWHSVACSTNASSLVHPSPPSNRSLHSSLYQSIHARAHSLIIPTAMTRNNSLPISTAVSGTFTLSVIVCCRRSVIEC